jgi:hypothetical protein
LPGGRLPKIGSELPLYQDQSGAMTSRYGSTIGAYAGKIHKTSFNTCDMFEPREDQTTLGGNDNGKVSPIYFPVDHLSPLRTERNKRLL